MRWRNLGRPGIQVSMDMPPESLMTLAKALNDTNWTDQDRLAQTKMPTYLHKRHRCAPPSVVYKFWSAFMLAINASKVSPPQVGSLKKDQLIVSLQPSCWKAVSFRTHNDILPVYQESVPARQGR